MRKLISLTLLLGVLAGIDIGARTVAEGQVEARAEAEAPRGAEASASINSFPFLGRLLVVGTIRETRIELRNVSAPGLVYARVVLDLRGVEIDRGRLIRAQEAEILDIASGTVTIEIAQEALSEKLGIPIRVSAGEVRATIAGQDVVVRTSVDNEVLSLSHALIPASLKVAIPKTNYAPCVGALTVLAGRLRFTCAINDVPPAFVGAANRVAYR